MTVELLQNQTHLTTGDEMADMADIGRCELVEGRVIPMTPPGYEYGEVEATIVSELRYLCVRIS